MGRAQGNRWRSHRTLAWSVRVAIFLLPIVIGLIASYLVATRLSDGDTVISVLFWWFAVVGSAVASAVVVERLLRRMVPVTTLLRLSLAFPDKAPSRFSVMLRSFTTRSIGRRLAAGELDHLPVERSASEELLSLLASLTAHDPQTRGHAERVRAYADLIGEELGLGQAERDRLRWGALLHDIGKVAVPTSLLNKTGRLDDSDWDVLRTHPAKGDELIAGLHDWLGDWRLTVVQHHERWDGTGYPLGLSGRDIALGGRIISVCDAFDAMTSVRAYGERLDAESARTEIARLSGEQFDPTVVRALMRVSIGSLRAPLGVWAWLPAFTVPGAIERLGKHASVVAAALLVLVGATALAADQTGPAVPAMSEIEVAGISIEPSDLVVDRSSPDGERVGSQPASTDSSADGSAPFGGPRSEAVQAGAVSAEDRMLTVSASPTEGSSTTEALPSAPTAPPAATATTEPPAVTTTEPPAVTTTTAPPVTTTTVTTSVSPPTTSPALPVAPAVTILVEEDGERTFVLNAVGSTTLGDPPSMGSATIDQQGNGWYRPDPDVNGVDTFTYRSCFDTLCAVGTVSVVIEAVNDTPVPVLDVVDVSSDGSVAVAVLDNDWDPDGDQLVVQSIGTPAFGEASTDGTVIHFQPFGEVGDLLLGYTVCDPSGSCSAGVVQITASLPVLAGAVDDSFVVVGPKPGTLEVLANDEIGPEPITISILEQPAGGSVHVLGNNGLLYKPQGFAGTAVFVYRACDSAGGCSEATVTVTVE